MILSLAAIDAAFRASWAADTCSADDAARTSWTADNPAWGHCDVTALVLHDLLGGDLIVGEVHLDGEQHGYHWWNRLDSGLEVDLTREQFQNGQVVMAGRVVTRPSGPPPRRRREYDLLRQRVLTKLGDQPIYGTPRAPSPDASDPVVAEVTRDGFVESLHRGRVVGLAATGHVSFETGDVTAPILLRSCAKPLQAVGLLRVGLDLDGPHLAVACASHDGTEPQVALVRDLLHRFGLDEDVLDNAALPPLDPRTAARLLLAGGMDRIRQNCSGKHGAMLATCVVNGWPTDGYLDPDHPVQKACTSAVEELTGESMAHMATDGCGAPIGAVSLVGMARAFSRLATASPESPEGRVAAAMRAHREVVGGQQRDVTRLMGAVPGLVAKDGAEGCYAAALPDGSAVGLKIADGSNRARMPVMVMALRRLGVSSPQLDELSDVPVLGHGRPVGSVGVIT